MRAVCVGVGEPGGNGAVAAAVVGGEGGRQGGGEGTHLIPGSRCIY